MAQTPQSDRQPFDFIQKPWFLWFIRGAAVVMLTIYLFIFVLMCWKNVPQRSDFPVLIASALAWENSHSLYQRFIYAPFMDNIAFIDRGPHDLMDNLNPPFFTFVMLPLTTMPLRWACMTWMALQFFGTLICLNFLIRCFFKPHALLLPATTLFCCVWFPLFANLLIGQMGGLLFILITSSWLAFRRDKAALAGIFLGLALAIKVFVGLIFVWLLLQKKTHLLLWACGTWGVATLAALAVFGLQDHLNWLQVLREQNHASQSWNGSLEGFVLRYFGGGYWQSPYDWPWMRFAIRATAWISSAGLLIWLSRQKNSFDIGFALCLPLMLFLSPYGWLYYFPVLLVSFILLAGAGLDKRWLTLSILLTSIPQFLAKGDNLKPELWKVYPYDMTVEKIKGEYVAIYQNAFYWFSLPDVYMIALLFLIVLIGVFTLRHAKTFRGVPYLSNAQVA